MKEECVLRSKTLELCDGQVEVIVHFAAELYVEGILKI